MSFWQAARREAAGTLRSVRYDFIQVLLGQRGSRRVVVLTGMTAVVAAGAVGLAFALVGGATKAPSEPARQRPAAAASLPAEPSELTDDASTTPSPSPSKKHKKKSPSSAPGVPYVDPTTGRPRTNPTPTHRRTHRPTRKPTHRPTHSKSPSPTTGPTTPPPPTDSPPPTGSESVTPSGSGSTTP